MKKIFATLAILGAMTFGLTSNVLAQDDEFFQEESEQVVEEAAEEAPAAEEVAPAAAPAAAPVAAPAAPAQEQPAVEEEVSMFKALKIKFIEGDAFFMSFVALCLIIGLALCIERIIYLSLAATNTKKLLEKAIDIKEELRYIEKVKELNKDKVLKYYILTMGCQLNENDSEKISGMATKMG